MKHRSAIVDMGLLRRQPNQQIVLRRFRNTIDWEAVVRCPEMRPFPGTLGLKIIAPLELKEYGEALQSELDIPTQLPLIQKRWSNGSRPDGPSHCHLDFVGY